MKFKATAISIAVGIMLIGLFANTLPAAEIITEIDIVRKGGYERRFCENGR